MLERLAAEKGLTFDTRSARPRGGRDGGCGRCGSACGISTAARCRQGGRAGCSSSSSFRSRSCIPQALDAGNLSSRFDVLIFVDGAIPQRDRAARRCSLAPRTSPSEYRERLGTVDGREDDAAAQAVRRRRRHVARDRIVDGDRLCTSGCRCSDALDRRRASRCRAEKFYVPGVAARGAGRYSAPARLRHAERVEVFFDESRAFRLTPEAAAEGVTTVAWFDGASAPAERVGLGPAVPRSGAADRRSAARPRSRRAVRSGNRLARAAARDVQVPVQRHLLRLDRATSAQRRERPTSRMPARAEARARRPTQTSLGLGPCSGATIERIMTKSFSAAALVALCVVGLRLAAQEAGTKTADAARQGRRANPKLEALKKEVAADIDSTGRVHAADGRPGVQLRRARVPGVRDVEVPDRHPREERLHASSASCPACRPRGWPRGDPASRSSPSARTSTASRRPRRSRASATTTRSSKARRATAKDTTPAVP